MDNVVLTRHIGGGTAEDLDLIATAVASGVVEALQGIRPDHIADPEVWPLRGPKPTRAAPTAPTYD